MEKSKTSVKTVSMSSDQAQLRLVAFAKRIVKGPQGENTTLILKKAHISGCTFSALKKAGLFEIKGGKFIFSGPLQTALAQNDFEEAGAIIRDVTRQYSADLVAKKKRAPKVQPQQLPFTPKEDPPTNDLPQEGDNSPITTTKGVPLGMTYQTKEINPIGKVSAYSVSIPRETYLHAKTAAELAGVSLEVLVNNAVLTYIVSNLKM